jgi:hypothetical protein
VRRVLVGVLAVLLGLPVSGWLVLRRQASALGARLVEDAQALEALRFSRAGTPGNELECLGHHADLAPDSSRAVPWTHPVVLGIREGSLPIDTLPAPMRAHLDAHTPWLGSLLSCAALDTVAPTTGVGPIPDVSHPRRQRVPRLQESVMALLPLRLRLLTATGQPDLATAECTAGLQLALDVYRLEGLEGLLGALATTRALVPACGAAADAASPEARRAHLAAIERLRAELPPFSRVMQLERVQSSLRLFGAWLPPDLDARLPPGARAATASARAVTTERGLASTTALRLYWRRFDAAMRRCADVADLEEPTRTTALVDAMKGFESPTLHRFFTSEPADLRYQLYAQEADQVKVMLELLAAAARLRDAPDAAVPPGLTRAQHDGLVTVTPVMAELSTLQLTVHLER